MLKVKEPIQLKNRVIMTMSSEGFYQRISANYEMLNLEINSEDLLHLVTRPAELFLAEGDETSIFQSVNIQNNQDQKLSIINNLLNRIMMTENAAFTYQDSIFISNILRKLGIKDEKNFMQEISSILYENRQVKQQLSILENNMESFREINKSYVKPSAEEREEQGSDRNAGKTELYLHQEIFNRLNTQAIYDTIGSFAGVQINESYVNQKEMELSEQQIFSERMNLQKLQNEMTQESLPLVYHSENIYEDSILNEGEEINENLVQNSLSKAVILALTSQLSQIRSQSYTEHHNEWLHVSDALFNSVENTINRYTENITRPIAYSIKESIMLSERDNNNVVREYLNQVIERTNEASADSRKAGSESGYDEAQLTYFQSTTVEGDESYQQQLSFQSSIIERLNQVNDNSTEVYNQTSTLLEQTDSRQRAAQERQAKAIEQVRRVVEESTQALSGIAQRDVSSEAGASMPQAHYTQGDTSVILQHVTGDEYTNLQVNELNQNNIAGTHTVNQYTDSSDSADSRQEATGQAQEAALESVRRAVESGRDYSLEAAGGRKEMPAADIEISSTHYHEGDTNITEQHITREDYIREHISQVEQNNIQNRNQYIRALEQLESRQQALNRQRRSDFDPNRQRRESLEAMENPMVLLQDYHREEEEANAADEKLKEEFFKELPESVRKYVKIIDEYQRNPEAFRQRREKNAAESGFQKDIESAAMVLPRQPEAENEPEQISSLARREINHIVNKITSVNQKETTHENISREVGRELSLVHKETETVNQEEIINQIVQERKITNQEKQVVNEITETEKVVNHTEIAQKVVNELVNTKEIENLVNQGVSKQLAGISDQVFARLERKMLNEKRRRGI